jgi:16S rRNA (cytosine967-C5)-methyltransferase
MALKRWGESARYAGSKDRAFVSGLALDALRRKRSLGWMMGDDSPRGVVLGVLGSGLEVVDRPHRRSGG